MKLIHISDLHLGKKLHGYELYEEQEDALLQVLDAVEKYQADGLIIAGDIYDTAVPPLRAVRMLDWFLSTLCQKGVDVYLISGNHDSATRLQFASSVLAAQHIYVAGEYSGLDTIVRKEDAWGKVEIHLLPFIRPSSVSPYTEEGLAGYTQAFAWALSKMEKDPSARQILVAHQFFAGSASSDSEELMVGGLDAIDPALLQPFDYAALGHLHRPQKIQTVPQARYSGTLLKYSISEASDKKSIVLITLEDQLLIDEIPIRPLRDISVLQGSYLELLNRKFYQNLNRDQYFDIILEDEMEIANVMAKLSVIYPRILRIRYLNSGQAEKNLTAVTLQKQKSLSPYEIMCSFFKEQNGQEPDEEMKKIIQKVVEDTEHETR